WAEYRFGAARGEPVVVCITLGTGIGGGLVLDGEVYRGAYGVGAEFGHMTMVPGGRRCACGNSGCWEMYASGTGLAYDAREPARQAFSETLTGRGYRPAARIAMAELGPRAGLVGAADLARRAAGDER